MTKFSIKELYEKEFEKIWEEASLKGHSITERGYSIQNEVHENGLLFIGINPSYNDDPSKIFYNNEQVSSFRYFQQFPKIAEYCKLTWSHIDLFFIRETNQKSIENYYYKDGKEFLEKQLNISKKIIELSKPRVIVVSNAFASKIFKSNFNVKFDNNIGTYKIIENEKMKNVPVFFTSMLTGQRALDNGSLERLKWHIRFCIR